MNRIIIVSLILISTVSFCNNKNGTFKSNHSSMLADSIVLYGDWKIIRFRAGSISEITEGDAQKYVGKIITLKPELVMVVNDTCNQPFFRLTMENSNKYFYENNRMNKAALEIKQDSIKVMEIGCKSHPKYSNENSPNFLYDFIVLDKDLMIVSFKGFYFYLERIMRAF